MIDDQTRREQIREALADHRPLRDSDLGVFRIGDVRWLLDALDAQDMELGALRAERDRLDLELQVLLRYGVPCSGVDDFGRSGL